MAILSVRAYVRTDAWSYILQILQIPISTACPHSRSPHNALHSLVLIFYTGRDGGLGGREGRRVKRERDKEGMSLMLYHSILVP